MRQYIPHGKAHEYPEIAHPLTTAEYKQVEQYLFSTAIEDGFVQEEESADSRFIPKFDGTGVPLNKKGNPHSHTARATFLSINIKNFSGVQN